MSSSCSKSGNEPSIFYFNMDTHLLKRGLVDAGYNENYISLCLMYAHRLNQNGVPVIFDNKHFALLLGIELNTMLSLVFAKGGKYRTILIPKKRKGYRKITIPIYILKYVQRWILDNILNRVTVSNQTMGFCKGKSILTNASMHTNKEVLLSIDIKEFFPSIKFERVFRLFYYLGYTKELSFTLSRIVTNDDELPQGAPTSPCISNIVCKRMDKRINSLVDRFRGTYTRYADDITISGNNNVIRCLPLLGEILTEEGFEINEDKVRIQRKGYRQDVTGLVVNNSQPSVPRELKRYLRQQIYYCRKYGVTEHLRHIDCQKERFKEHLYGLAYFIKMVEEDEGRKYLCQLDSIIWHY